MQWIVGIDEVGRGPLAGPVCVCAVAMPQRLYNKANWEIDTVSLTDSKKMSPRARAIWNKHAQLLKKKGNIKIGIAMRSAAHIDHHGISVSIASCIKAVLDQLHLDSHDSNIFLDGGLRAPAQYKKQITIIKGDSLHPIISLASVVAKEHRDSYMRRLHTKHANYGWDENKGYGTAMHRQAIRAFGPTALHRKTFISKVIL